MTALNILVFDHNFRGRTHVVDTLTELGHEVDVVSNAVLAARCIMNHRPDVLIVDAELPIGVARQLVTWMRRHDNASTPILVLSSSDDSVSGGAERESTPTVEVDWTRRRR